MRTTAPDLQLTVDDMIAEGDKVVVRWTFRGTHTGVAASGTPPTRTPLTALAIGIYRFVDGKLAEDWGMATLCQTETPWT